MGTFRSGLLPAFGNVPINFQISVFFGYILKVTITLKEKNTHKTGGNREFMGTLRKQLAH